MYSIVLNEGVNNEVGRKCKIASFAEKTEAYQALEAFFANLTPADAGLIGNTYHIVGEGGEKLFSRTVQPADVAGI